MARPCINDHDTLMPDSCAACFWCASRTPKGRKYRVLWGEPEPKATHGNAKQRVALGNHVRLKEE